MSPTLRLVLILAMAVYFTVLLLFVRRRGLNLKYFLLWLVMGVALFVLILFPGILTAMAHLLCIQSEMNALISAVCFFIILLEISLTAIVSRLNDKLTRTIQQTALLEKRIRALEQALEEKEKDA